MSSKTAAAITEILVERLSYLIKNFAIFHKKVFCILDEILEKTLNDHLAEAFFVH